MPTTISPATTPWSEWKRAWQENVCLGAMAACLETGALSVFLYMFVQDFHRLFSVAAIALVLFLVFHIGISAWCAHIRTHSKTASIAEPPPSRW